MIENQASHTPEASEPEEPISALDAASYCYAMAGEMARVARSGGMDALAMALDHVRAMASLAMTEAQSQKES